MYSFLLLRFLFIITPLLLMSPEISLADFYVSPNGSDSNPGTISAPFKTIDKAKTAVRAARSGMTSDITVFLRGGTYELSSTINFDSNDSGINGKNVIYKAFPGEIPYVSGGRTLSGPWTSLGGGIYQTSAQGYKFRQLIVNGRRGTRARTPNVGSNYNVQMWVGNDYSGDSTWNASQHYVDINASDITTWNNMDKVEMAVSREWELGRFKLSSFTKQNNIAHLTFQPADHKNAFTGFCYLREPNDQNCLTWLTPIKDPYYFENAREFLDQPGEWYLDESANTVYYMPRSGENLSSAIVNVPNVERLVYLSGVQNFQIKGITFENSTWMAPSGGNGFRINQGDGFGDRKTHVPTAILIENSNTVLLERNVIRNTGAGAISIEKGSRNISLIGNVIREIAAAGILVGVWNDNSISSNTLQNIIIKNNYINGVSRDYHSSQGIQANYVKSMYIDHNEVTDAGYTGIGMDWRGDDGAASVDVQITNNHVHNVMNKLADGGGIYTFWVTKGQTKITGNYVHGIRRSNYAGQFPIGAIYLDEGSNYVYVRNNVLADAEEIIHTNFYANPGASSSNDYGGSNPSFDAAIQANAGIESAYNDIKTLGIGYVGGTTIKPNSPKGLRIIN